MNIDKMSILVGKKEQVKDIIKNNNVNTNMYKYTIPSSWYVRIHNKSYANKDTITILNK